MPRINLNIRNNPKISEIQILKEHAPPHKFLCIMCHVYSLAKPPGMTQLP